MDKFQCSRMQKVPAQRNTLFIPQTETSWRAVKRVPHNRMPQRSQMHANLMGPPGADPQFQQRELSGSRAQPLLYSVVGNRLPTAFPTRGHANPPHPVAANAAADRSPVLLHPAVHQDKGSFLDFPPGHMMRD